MPEDFLEGWNLSRIRRLFQGLGLFREVASDQVASPESS